MGGRRRVTFVSVIQLRYANPIVFSIVVCQVFRAYRLNPGEKGLAYTKTHFHLSTTHG